jgi:hypothetical protein
MPHTSPAARGIHSGNVGVSRSGYIRDVLFSNVSVSQEFFAFMDSSPISSIPSISARRKPGSASAICRLAIAAHGTIPGPLSKSKRITSFPRFGHLMDLLGEPHSKPNMRDIVAASLLRMGNVGSAQATTSNIYPHRSGTTIFASIVSERCRGRSKSIRI